MKSTLRVLHVEDSEKDVALLTRHLSRAGYELVSKRVDTGPAMRAALETSEWDVILCDYSMPSFNALAALEVLKDLGVDTPFIIISGTVGETVAVEAMRSGAHDYLMKDNLVRLSATIERELHEAENRRARRRAEEALKTSEGEMRALFEAMTDVILVFDRDGRHLKVAPSRPAHVYKPAAERVGKTLHEIFPKDEADFFLSHIHHALAEGKMHRFEYELEIAGRLLWFENSVSPMSEDSVMWIAREITENKQAEQQEARLHAEIEMQRRRLDNIVSTVPGVVWEAWGEPAAATQRIDFVSDYVESMLGYSVEEWLATPNFWLTIVHPDDKEQVGRGASEAFVLGQSATLEFRWVTKDGDALWVESNFVVIKDDEGRSVGLRGVSTDISARKRADERQARRAAHALFRADVSAALAVSGAPLRATLEWCTQAMVEHLQAAFARIWTLNSEEDVLELQASAGMYTHIDGGHARVPVGKFKIGKIAEERAPHITNQVPTDPRVGDKEWAAREGMVAFAGHPLVIEDRLLGVMALFSRSELPDDTIDALASVADIISQGIERKRAEAELRQSEERYRDLVENARDIIYSHDLEGNYTSSNKASQDLTGYTKEEALKVNIAQTVAPEYLDKAREMLTRKLAGETVTAYELELITKDGRRVPVEVNTRLVLKDGIPVGFQGIARDISDRKRAQAELNRLAAAVQQTAESILITDPDGNIEYANPAFERISGYSREEVLGQNPRLLKSGKTDDAVYRDLWQKISQGEVWVGLLINRKKDGTLFTERATISAVLDESGKIVQYVAVKQDTTHEMHLEGQLRQAQKMEAIGQLAGGVAHDFNNLLTAINGYTSLALQKLDDENSVKPYLEEVKKAGERATNLTRQLLAFGRKQILQPVALDLNGVVTDMNKMLRRLIGEDIELRAQLAPALKRTKGDPGQIEQVLVNLVVNARDAMPRGGTMIIETANAQLDQEFARNHVGSQAGNYVMLAVSDTGCGMAEETRARIFEPFFTTKEKGKGTGLGLSTVYGIVKQSGGSIWVYSELGKGTSFKVYLPEMTESSRPAEKGVSPEETIPGGRETVLLVEDEEMVRGLTTKILEQAGYNVVAARGGDEALQLCTELEQKIDLLLTDVVMPGASGKEVAETMTRLMPGIRVLFMSGYTDEAIVHHGVLDSNVEFIQKPFTPFSLSKKVREVLDLQPAGR